MNSKMRKEKGLQSSSPLSTEDVPVHTLVRKGKKKNPSSKSVSNQRLLKSTASSRARARSVSPKSGPWVPAPGKATRGGRVPWQVAGHKLDVNHVRANDLSTDEEERVGGEVRRYEKKINNLINEVGSLKNEVVLQKALQEIEHKEELLNTSSRMLQEQEAELEHVQDELQQMETENTLLRQNVDLISQEAEITKTQKEQLNYEREKLMKKLIEAEMDGQAAAHQVRELKELIRQLQHEQCISSADHHRFAKHKDLFLKTMADFEVTNRTLQCLLRDQHRLEASGLRLSEQHDILLRKVADGELINERMRNQLLDCEALISELRNQLLIEKEERLALSNLQGSLESTRGHLQKQLRTKEGDCNRLSVQIRNLEGQLAQARIENGQLLETINSSKNKSVRDKEALKKAARAHKSRAERLEEELSQVGKHLTDLQRLDCEARLASVNSYVESLSREKQILIGECEEYRARVTELEALVDRVEENAKSQNESLTTRLHEKVAESAGLRLECERLKSSVSFVEGKMSQIEKDAQQLRGMVKQYEKLVDEYKDQANRVKNEVEESFGRKEEQSRERERLQRDGEEELEKVKQQLQQRLQELEPLPELLRATELRLHEANEKILSYERRNIENAKIIAELTTRLEHSSENLDEVKSKCKDSQESNRSLQSRHESLERRLRELEEQNVELQASHTKLQDTAQQESLKLEEKSRENASLTRQLENALADGRKQSEQTRDRYSSKERTYQTRIIDLETQLSQLRTEQARMKREKEENERKFNSRLYDLRDRLEQCHSTNRSMQNYVQFLKNSYSNVFGETASSLPPPSSPLRPYARET